MGGLPALAECDALPGASAACPPLPIEERSGRQVAAGTRLEVAAEILDLVESLHNRGQIFGAFGPDDFLIDDGRITCVASDRVMPVKASADQRPVFPPERYPAPFSAPETRSPSSPLDERSDLFSWASLTQFLLLGGRQPTDSTDELLSAALSEIAASDSDSLQAILPRKKRSIEGNMVQAWMACLRHCLAEEPNERPSTVDDLRRLALNSCGSSAWRRLWRSVVAPASGR